MARRVLVALFSTLMLTACGTEESATGGEYIVVGRTPTAPDRKYFQAIEIQGGKATPILSIQETTGRIYLPTMSSLPECNKKVIQGFISEDTVFITTKVLRDTTVPTVGL
jgi:hypothetical protein